MLDTVVFTDPKAIAFFADDMVLAKINAEEDTAAAARYHIMGYPTSVLISQDGTEIDRLIGFAETDEYIGTMKEYEQGIGTLDDLLARFSEEADRAMAFEIADKYKYRGASEEAETWYGKVLEMGEPTDSLAGESRFAIADMYRRLDDYDRAIEAYSSIMEDFEGTDFAEGAEIYRAISIRDIGDTARAIAAFEAFVGNYPDSSGAKAYAEKQITKLKGQDSPTND